MTRYRTLTGPWKLVFAALTWLGIAVSVYNIFRLRVAGVEMFNVAYLATLLGCFIPLVFLIIPATSRSPRDRIPWYDVLLAAVSLAGPVFVIVSAERMAASDWEVDPPPFGLILGLTTWLITLEGLRRAGGQVVAGIVGVFSVYPLFAAYMPSVLFGKNYSLKTLVGYHFLGTSSIFGLPMQVFGDLLIGFLIFGAALQITGAGRFLIDIAQVLLGRIRGGPALVAVASSAMFASLSGSAVSNVATVGSITIPTMKKLGYPSHYAAAIESCASVGGLVTPPVMGATAFIMASFLRVPYAAVALAAAIPMFLYYISLFGQVYLFAQRNELSALSRSEIPSLGKVLRDGWYYLGSLVVLVYLLFYVRVEAWAPFYAAAFLFACAFIRKSTRPNLATLGLFTRNMGTTLTELLPIMAGVGMLIGGLSMTGVAQSFASEVLALSGGNLYLLLLFGSLSALVLGTGMPITVVYIFSAMIFVPALANVGLDPMAAHLFFLYWGMMGDLTPPTCVSVYVASNLAGSPVMRTALRAMRLGVVGFIIPFFFVLDPALIGHGSIGVVIESIVTAMIGFILIAGSIEQYMVGIGRIGPLTRIVFAVSGILLAYPGWLTDVLGAALAAAILIWSYSANRLTRGAGCSPRL
ncbi:MAG: TRAP transporter fused permease subunit [Chloroflexi bacterium]|nr:TRAP transporter fused permease subunit [Chloroflexota bacterium]